MTSRGRVECQESGVQQPAFRGVERSIRGQRWVGLSPEHDRMALAISEHTEFPPLVCRVLARQGNTPESVHGYLDPKIRNLMPDPSTLKDMDSAVSRFVQAVEEREAIAIFADYDVDGGSSAALLIDWLRQLGMTATLHVPDRIEEGFGPNVNAMKRLASSHDLIICVDCGTGAFDPIKAADQADVIILDHHIGEPSLPEALAVVNPNRQDETSELVHICAAGVVFVFLAAVNRAMRPKRDDLPNLIPMLDLVALATVADVSPLVGLNRAFVRAGIEFIRRRRRPGLRALMDVAGLNSVPNCGHLGFVLGPRINAGGRIGQSDMGARLLSTDKKEEAEFLAQSLHKLNQDRRQLGDHAYQEALGQAEARGLSGSLVWAAGEGWHPGVVGIVAARLSELANRPAIVLSKFGGIARGSARSIPGVSIGAAIVRCRDEGWLLKGGGHNMAAGLEVDLSRLEGAMDRIGAMIDSQDHDFDLPKEVRIDGEVQPEAATIGLIEQLEQVGPFGSESPHPRVVLPFQQIVFRRVVGDGHLQMTVQGPSQSRISAISFRAMDNGMGEFLMHRGIGPVHLLGRLEVDHFRGRATPKLHVDDAAPA